MRESVKGRIGSLAALIVAGMLMVYGSHVSSIMESKIVSQTSINQRLDHHINAYQTLESRVKGWDEGYLPMSSAKDLLGIFQALGLGRFDLGSNLDEFRLTEAAPYIQSNHAVGLVKVCMDNGGGELKVQAKDYQTLLSGLTQMANSPDVSFSSVTIQGEREIATAMLGNACMLLRDDTIG